MSGKEQLETGVKPAPGDLALVQAFVNTLDVESEEDKLKTPEALSKWLTRRGLMPPRETASEEEHREALEFREALRSLLVAHNGQEAGDSAMEAVARVADSIPLVVRADRAGGLALEPAGSGVGAALGRLLAIAMTATATGTWSRLKACRSGTCRWAFYDSSKNRSGVWCDMAVCGSREKARAYRRRHSGSS